VIAIEAENLTKLYRVYVRPLDRLKEAMTRRPCHHLVEALREVSFQVPAGGTLGIIGENGAGKSTLLKILAGTTQPTAGTLVRRGRAAALLELGSGFHPEFTGRGNIHLNAALLGLSESEIKEREASIIEFAELESVIDRPVKTYSSGMYMRLAFSIATSVDPEVLIVDEALSVGDQRFQQKCVERMAGFRKAGKTLILCSHSMFLINELCEESIWLDRGRVQSYGKTQGVISEYLAYLEEKGGLQDTLPETALAEQSALPDVLIEELSVLDDAGIPAYRFEQFQPLLLRVRTRRTGPPFPGHLGVGLLRPDGQQVFGAVTKNSGRKPIVFSGNQTTELLLPSVTLLGGSFRAKAVVTDEHAIRVIHELSTPPFLIESEHAELGLVWIEHRWRFPEPREP
jgi:ABC-type polysaccharide/polyol phosphate transport system ATPase subunit